LKWLLGSRLHTGIAVSLFIVQDALLMILESIVPDGVLEMMDFLRTSNRFSHLDAVVGANPVFALKRERSLENTAWDDVLEKKARGEPFPSSLARFT
jgi:hypothetical protein